MELRAGFAADLLALGHSRTVVKTRMTEEYELSRRQARRITAKAMDLIVQDFEEINIERPQMVAKLLVNLEQGMQKTLFHNQSSSVAACARHSRIGCGLSIQHKRKEKTFNLISWYLFLPTSLLTNNKNIFHEQIVQGTFRKRR